MIELIALESWSCMEEEARNRQESKEGVTQGRVRGRNSGVGKRL